MFETLWHTAKLFVSCDLQGMQIRAFLREVLRKRSQLVPGEKQHFQLFKIFEAPSDAAIQDKKLERLNARVLEKIGAASNEGIQQGIAQLYGLEEKGKALKLRMVEIAEPWRPYRTLASRYIWRWKDSQKK